MNWRGRPLTSHEVIVQTIAATTTRTGLTVRAQLDTGSYPAGVKVSDQEMAALPITRHGFHGDWNYCLHPDTGRARRTGAARPRRMGPRRTGSPRADRAAPQRPAGPGRRADRPLEHAAGTRPPPAAGQRPATGTRSRRPSQADTRRPGPGHPPAPAPRPPAPPAGPAARGEPDHHQPGDPGNPATAGPARTRHRPAASSPPPHTRRHLRVRRKARHHAPAGLEISVLIICEP
jgi:hypothetical protein